MKNDRSYAILHDVVLHECEGFKQKPCFSIKREDGEWALYAFSTSESDALDDFTLKNIKCCPVCGEQLKGV